MDDAVLNTIVAISGLIATWLGVILTSWFSQRADPKRRDHENETCWHERRLILPTDLVNVSRKIEDGILEAAAFTDDEDRYERLLGHKSVLLTPKEVVADSEEYSAADALYDVTLDAIGALESFLPSTSVSASAYALRDARTDFVRVSRKERLPPHRRPGSNDEITL